MRDAADVHLDASADARPQSVTSTPGRFVHILTPALWALNNLIWKGVFIDMSKFKLSNKIICIIYRWALHPMTRGHLSGQIRGRRKTQGE